MTGTGSCESESEVAQSCPTLCDPMDCSPPGFSIHEFSRQEYWSGLPFPSPGRLSNPGIKLLSPAFQADALPSEPPGYPIILLNEESKLQNNMDSILPGFCLKKKNVSFSPTDIYKG